MYDDEIRARFNTLRPRQNGRHFADDTFKLIFLNENVWISIKISLEFAPKGPINNIPALVQMMAWCRPGNKPLSEPVMVRLLTHICITRPQWVNIKTIIPDMEISIIKIRRLEMALRQSYLYNGNHHAGKMSFLYCDSPQNDIINQFPVCISVHFELWSMYGVLICILS